LAKKEDPFMLANYRFLPNHLRVRVDEFIEKLDKACRQFVVKRYVEGKALYQVAEEMGYAERTIYSIRDRVIDLWNLTFLSTHLEYNRERILNVIKRYGVIEHHRLVNNLHLNRSGLNRMDFKDILEVLIVTGQIKLRIIKPGPKGRPKRQYIINNSAIIQPLFSHGISI